MGPSYLQIDKTLIAILDASPWGSFQSRRGRYLQPTLQSSLFPVAAANGPLKPKRRQLATRGLSLFSDEQCLWRAHYRLRHGSMRPS